MTQTPDPMLWTDQISARIDRLEWSLSLLLDRQAKQEKWLKIGGGSLIAACLMTIAWVAFHPATSPSPPADPVPEHAAPAESAPPADTPPTTPPPPPATPESALTGDALVDAAQGGNPEAQYQLGLRLAEGKDFVRDTAKAQAWWQQAAAKGHAGALYQIGIGMLTAENGSVSPENTAAAVRWLEAAAAAGNADGAYRLGQLHETGLDGASDPATALGWYKRADQLGKPEAKAALARLSKPGKP
jgi:localization factor PodJL